MNKGLRFGLLLLLPVMIAAFYLESQLEISPGAHTALQIMIVLGTYWLAWRWVIYDEIRSQRELHRMEPPRYNYRIAPPVAGAKIIQNEAASRRPDGTTKAAADDASSSLRSESIIVSMEKPENENKTRDLHLSLARVAHALMSVGIVFALTIVMFLIGVKILGEGVIALLYLVPIGWCTVHWGRLVGVSAALTAALSFDYLFIPPYGTLHIGSLEGWLLLFIFIATAILIVGRIQSILIEGRERERRVTFLYEVVSAISNLATREGIARAVANQIQQKFQAEGVQVHLTGGWGYPSFTFYSDQKQASTPSGNPDRSLPIVSGSETIGEVIIWQGIFTLPADDDPMLQTMLRQIAAALNRVRAAEGKSPYSNQKPAYPDGNSFQTTHS